MSLYNLKNPAVKRLMREAEELREPTVEYAAYPLEDNLFEWHFTLRGPPGTDFEGGVYHGRIALPPEYPMRPPSILLLTPNGRFEVNKKICLSISGHHPETWQPSWSIRTALLAIIGFLPTHGNGAIGSLDYTPEERKCLASKSQNWKCTECGFIKNVLKEATPQKESLELQKKSTVPQPPCLVLNGDLREGGGRSVGDGKGRSPRLRHASGNSGLVTRAETTTVESDQMKKTKDTQANSICNFVSLLTIWLIVIIFAVLVGRRVLYQ